MKITTFDFLPYGKNLTGHLGYPVGRQHFDREIAAQTYQNHIEQFQLYEEIGIDAIFLNEHHGSPYGLDNSPNVFLAYVAAHTKHVKLGMLGNLLPIHAHPFRVAEELAMLDVMTRGRLIAGFARGIPREHLVYGVPLNESRARFDEALDVILNAWTQDVFTHHGRFFHYDSVDMWPRPYQEPCPPVWIGAIDHATTRHIAELGARWPITLCVNFQPTPEVKKQMHVFREAAAGAGRTVGDDDICYGRHVFVAETEKDAERYCKPYVEYYFRDLMDRINNAALGKLKAMNPDVDWNRVKPPFDYGAATYENLRERGLLLAGTPDRVFKDLMEQYEEVGGFGALLAMIRMADMPQDVLVRCLRLMGDELIPKIHAAGKTAVTV